jgi:hypothetical protein
LSQSPLSFRCLGQEQVTGESARSADFPFASEFEALGGAFMRFNLWHLNIR